MKKYSDGRKKEVSLRYIERYDPDYPPYLRRYDRMPAGIYVAGDLPDPTLPSVAIVGARKCSIYGKKEAERFGCALASQGVQVISGLAYGIDVASQIGALKAGGKTFAVLGSGADVCYPKENQDVYDEILEKGGGIISEFDPGTEAAPWHFPLRNRIISALADLVLVIEARKRSGSLITVEYALEQGKSVYAIPGRNGDSLSSGCNALIAQGAGIAISPEMILEELAYVKNSAEEEILFGEEAEEEEKTDQQGEVLQRKHLLTAEGLKKADEIAEKEKMLPPPWNQNPTMTGIYQALAEGEQSLEDLRQATGFSLVEISNAIVILCMEKLVWIPLEGYYARS